MTLLGKSAGFHLSKAVKSVEFWDTKGESWKLLGLPGIGELPII